jgi:adenylosuccinate lyase
VFHEVIRTHALDAWAALRAGDHNPLEESLATDEVMLQLMSSDDVRACLKADDYVGDAPIRARRVAEMMRNAIGDV